MKKWILIIVVFLLMFVWGAWLLKWFDVGGGRTGGTLKQREPRIFSSVDKESEAVYTFVDD